LVKERPLRAEEAHGQQDELTGVGLGRALHLLAVCHECVRWGSRQIFFLKR
jgi:hypothetical protein